MVSRRWLALAIALSPGLAATVASCTSDPAPATPTADASAERRALPGEDFDSSAVTFPDAEAGARPPPTLPGCLGDPLPITASGERTYFRVDMTTDGGRAQDGGPMAGDFLIDFGANGSTIDFEGFPPPGPTPTQCFGDAAAPGASCSFSHFDFFGPWGTVQLQTASYGFLINSLRQAGIIGTDFLSTYPFTLDFHGKRIFRARGASFCTSAQLLAAGYAPVPSTGFYTNNTNTLRPLSDVITDPDASTAGFTVPNIPTVPITVAGVSALAQLDTGYDDRIQRHSININEAMLARLQAAIPNGLARRVERDLFLTTCVPGLSQAGRAYELNAGTEVNFIAEGGGVARRDTGRLVFVKERLPAAERCGGVETWTVPAAQMGASFLVDAQAAIFDPIASKVWLPKD